MKKTIRHKVEEILSDYPETRNSDIKLYIKYLQRYFCKNDAQFIIVEDILERAGTSLAGLTRQRAHIQNKLGKYLSSDQVEKMRNEQQERMRQEFSPSNPSNF